MLRDYMMVSPSLDGVLVHDSLTYEGLKRPVEVIRVLDGPRTKGRKGIHRSVKETVGGEGAISIEDRQILETYFQDLYSVFLKRLSVFAIESNMKPDEPLKLQALFQELLKIKDLLTRLA